MVNMIRVILPLIASFIICAQALYSKGGPVKLLDNESWKEMMKSDQLWMIEFYAPWCGHCKQLAPEWTKAAKNLKGVVNVAAVDMTENEALGAPYGIQGFPTIKFFGFDKKKPEDYQSGRDADSITKYALGKVNSEVKARTQGKGDKSSSSSGSKGSGSTGGSKQQGPATDKDVVVLTEANFDAYIRESKDIIFVEFYAPWCGHCKALEPEWNQAASQMKGKVVFAKVDATENQGLAQRFGVQGYPTIKYFDYNSGRQDRDAKPYQGAREASALISFSNELLEKADIPPEIHELHKQSVFADECTGPKVCIITFLPNIYESSAAERNAYLDMIMSVAKKNRSKPFAFFWLQAGDQLDLERSLNLGFGYPAVIAASQTKSMFATMTASFNKDNLSTFLDKTLTGSASYSQLPKDGIKIKKKSKWDGKDAEPIVEEYYDEDL